MVSLLECIERTPAALEAILAKRHENFAPLFAALEGRLNKLEEIIFVGSGTSNTSALTSRIFVEKVTGIRTIAAYPNDFCHNTGYYNPEALYVFTSQTGTSIVSREAQRMMNGRGFLTCAITESPETPIAKESQVHIDLCCGYEEQPTRTLGYCASVFTHMVLGLELGLRRGHITQEEYDGYIAQAASVPDSHRAITPRAMRWMDTCRRKFLRSQCMVFTGADALQGVAMEAAVKVWEIPQHIAIGYELEEGLHGANYGYNYSHCVVVLNHGGRESKKALALARWMKDIYKNGFVIGSEVIDETDFPIDLKGGDFDCLEIAPVIQILAFRMAQEEGRDLLAPHDNSVMESYFKTHA